jgi:hypothetical protein
MAAPSLTAQARRAAAKYRLAASSVAPVGSGYERSLRPGESRFSWAASLICSKGGP